MRIFKLVFCSSWLLVALGCAGPQTPSTQPLPAHPAHAATTAVTTAPIPGLLTLQADALALTQKRQKAGDPSLQAPYRALLQRASRALSTPPRSVTHKTTLPPSGDKHDYMSMGPYWWPNPNTSNGLPYVQRDGQRNPQSAGNALDSIRMQQMVADALDLALAYHFSGEARYAQQAAVVLRTWFLDPATRMNPHLRFGQAVPGIAEGRGIGIIDTRDLWFVIDAVALTSSAPASLTSAEQTALRQWFADYALWMDTSPLGQDERAAKNNHGLFYDVQLAAYWLYTGDIERARDLVFKAQTTRFAAQFDEQGRMPLELARTRPFHYHTFTLEAATRLARYGQVLNALPAPTPRWPATDTRCQTAAAQHPQCPLDLWRLNQNGKALKAVLTSVAQAVTAPANWTYTTPLEPSLV